MPRELRMPATVYNWQAISKDISSLTAAPKISSLLSSAANTSRANEHGLNTEELNLVHEEIDTRHSIQLNCW